MAYFEIENLQKSFLYNHVLNGINMQVEQGEVVSLIGGSGNGKTTLLRCIAGLEQPDDGYITIGDQIIYPNSSKSTSNLIGFVFQNFNLFPQYTVLQNVTLAMDNQLKQIPQDLRKRFKAKNKEIALELLDKMNLLEKADFYPCQLSGGQKQRVAIARALALQPEVLLFDEPTSALDPKITKDVAELILKLKESHTIIVVTHDMDFAKRISDRVYFINKGNVDIVGTAEEIFESKNPDVQRFLGSSEDE